VKKHKCIALFSGGLDSLLAVVFMQKLGYRVFPIFFETPFFKADKAKLAAERAGIQLHVHDITDQHLQMLHNPRYGFGKNLNPCIDCHGLMFKTAANLLSYYQADFLISGEVLGQRPMSQRKDALNAVGKLSTRKELLIRPLSQKLLPDTKPILEGWVDKNELLDIEGRGRTRQMQMAKELGIEFYNTPGGGCLLTDKGYSRKLLDLINHEMLDEKFIEFLKVGRHFRLNEKCKFIVGRNDRENEQLGQMTTYELVFHIKDNPGPLGIIQCKEQPDEDEIDLAARLLLRYSNKSPQRAEINYGKNQQLVNCLTVEKMKNQAVEQLQI
jgi:tRNA U34 2-thiouridine synthase MnmA/TrmU